MNANIDSPSVQELIGKYILIGITLLDHEGNLIEQNQHHGIFKSMDLVIHISLNNSEDFTLPPDLSTFKKAEPGEYKLRSTGEIVKNPDYLSTWTVYARDPSQMEDE